jgi:hypothetical protein
MRAIVDPSDALQLRRRRADIRDVDAAHGTRRKLGELLVEEGFLTEEQLADALVESVASGRKIGAVLVERGVLSGPALANFLADQQGGIVRTEWGIATGYRKTHTASHQAAQSAPDEVTDYVVVVATEDGMFALLPGRGALPDAGSEVAMPLRPGERFVVARHEWRKCVVVEPARDASAAA